MNWLIRFSLQHRLVIVCLAILTLLGGGYVSTKLPIDIFPSLTRPRVTIMTEAPGLSPEEVESLVTIPLETTLNGATGVEAVRTASGIGLSVIYVEFGWNTNVYTARQIVNERLSVVANSLPPAVRPQLSPISSIMGQIMMVGMWSRDDSTPPMQIRTLADWVVRQRLLTIPGVAQVITMGGERKQYQVQVDPDLLVSHDVTLVEVERALRESNANSTGGYVERSSMEFLVRGLGRAKNGEDIAATVVKTGERPILIRDVAKVVEGAQIKRGDSSANGHPAVILTIAKQPDADTRKLTEQIEAALVELQNSFKTSSPDIILDASLYQQRSFIDLGIHNVLEALRDSAILVVIILFLFLMNFRTTLITLTAIPLSIVTTGIVFYLLGLSVNVMTLGGIAVAMGELVDDAIVDIENVLRRLQENGRQSQPRNSLVVIYEASLEVRGSIVYSTMLVILVFIPLFALSGMEGRLFAPLGVAYIVSILASLVVSLTVTPVLGSLLLGKSKVIQREHDGWLLASLKRLATPIIRLGFHPVFNNAMLLLIVVSLVGSGWLITRLGSQFLPEFDEGAAQVNVFLPPGSSLSQSNHVAGMVDAAFRKQFETPGNPKGLIRSSVRRTGRAEMDEHAESVNVTEYVLTMNPDSGVSREDSLAKIRADLEEIPGVEYEVEQPLAHLISHMISGVTAKIAIKLYGDDLDTLRAKANEIKAAIQTVDGLAPPVVEAQTLIPQVRIELDRERLALYGATPGYVNEFIETALNGRTVSTILEGQRTFDLVVRLDDAHRTDYANLSRLSVDLPSGERVPLSALGRVYEGAGPNVIKRENVRRVISIRCNPTTRDLGSAVSEIRKAIVRDVKLPEGYYIEFSGQFEAQQQATRQILLLSAVALGGVFLVLYTLFPSVPIVLQIMLALPVALIGGILALWFTGQTMSVAAMVGFISLGGIAARNGILLVSHYEHLMREEGEPFSEATILRGSLERLAPVLMTALAAGIGLVPLVIGGHQPGKEILYPVATVIVGGLITSTLCEYLVHPGLFWRFSGAGAACMSPQRQWLGSPPNSGDTGF